MSLSVISTHPIQYHAPIYRLLQAKFGIPVTVIYGSDFSVNGYLDREFEKEFSWDSDLLSGYSSIFLSRVSANGARDVDEVRPEGLARALKQSAPKAVLILGYSHRLYRAAFHEAFRFGCAVMFRGETTDSAKKRNAIRRRIRDAVLRRLYRRLSFLLYVGRNSLAHFKRLGCPDEKLIFSPYCVDEEIFQLGDIQHSKIRPETRRGLGISENERVLLFSGKLAHRKGPDILISAVKRLPGASRERTTVLFIGDGKMRSALEKMAKESPPVKSVFAGFKNQKELGAYYHAADALVLPSRHSETWGLVVNEALYHGLPCIVSDAVGCAPDLVDEGVTGYCFRNGSIQDLTISIEKALTLIQKPETFKRCREQAALYSAERAAGGIAQAYKKVIDEG